MLVVVDFSVPVVSALLIVDLSPATPTIPPVNCPAFSSEPANQTLLILLSVAPPTIPPLLPPVATIIASV